MGRAGLAGHVYANIGQVQRIGSAAYLRPGNRAGIGGTTMFWQLITILVFLLVIVLSE